MDLGRMGGEEKLNVESTLRDQEERYRREAEALAKKGMDAAGVYAHILALWRGCEDWPPPHFTLAEIAYEAERDFHPHNRQFSGREEDPSPGVYVFRQRWQRETEDTAHPFLEGRLFRALRDILPAVDPDKHGSLANEMLRPLGLKVRDRSALLAGLGRKNEKGADDGDSRRGFTFKDPEPWPDPVDGADLLDAIVEWIRQHVILKGGEPEKAALYCLFSWTLDAFGICPRLLIWSPEPECGKTTLIVLMGAMIRRPLLSSNVTASVLFRVIDRYGPTLCLDEFERVDPDTKKELIAVLNSGTTRASAFVWRNAPTGSGGEKWEPQRFSTWAAIIFARIGRKGDVAGDSRCIVIKMDRATKKESKGLKGFREDRLLPELETIRRKCARWAADNLGDLRDADPKMPDVLFNREADKWRPLLAIADLAGGDWPEKTRSIAIRSMATPDDPSYRTQALEDCRTIFDAQGVDRISGKALSETMRELEDRPWGEWGRRGNGLTPNALCYILGDFGIKSRTVRFETGTRKGYHREDFEEAWRQYLSPTPPDHFGTSSHPAIEAESARESPDPTSEQGQRMLRSGFTDPGSNSGSMGDCDDVTKREGGMDGEEKIGPTGGPDAVGPEGESPREPEPEPEASAEPGGRTQGIPRGKGMRFGPTVGEACRQAVPKLRAVHGAQWDRRVDRLQALGLTRETAEECAVWEQLAEDGRRVQ